MHHKLLTLDAAGVKFSGANEGQFSGYASVFDGVDSYGDTIHPGAYKNTLTDRQRPIQLRWNHYGPVIGKWTAIREDDKGLYVEGELTPGHSRAMDVYASMKHGAVNGLSIGYVPRKWIDKPEGGKDLYEIDLIEISVVESPADLAATIGDIKSLIDQADTFKELESILRDVGGFSHTVAKAILAKATDLKSKDLRDVGSFDVEALATAIKLKTFEPGGLKNEH